MGLEGVLSVAAGSNHSLAVRYDGTVWAWGDNSSGQLGNGSFAASSVPIQVSGLSDVTAVAAGDAHSLVATLDGSGWAWGYGPSTALMSSNWSSTRLPRKVDVTGLLDVTAGGYLSMAQTAFGTLWAGGENDWGQRGNGNDFVKVMPSQVLGLTGGVMAMATGGNHSLAVGADGLLWAWGDNSDGQLGVGTAFDALVPAASLLY